MNKYRAWLKEEKRMVEVVSIDYREPLGIYFQAKNNKELLDGLTKGFILMQSTGLKKHPCFEGDICFIAFVEKLGSFNIPDDCIGKEISRDEYYGEIIKEDGAFWVNDKNNGKIRLTDKCDEFEILGNIYQP